MAWLSTKIKLLLCVINGGPGEDESFEMGEVRGFWCRQYVCLGSVFTCDGSVTSAIAAHAQAKMCHMCHILKFSVLKNNFEVPFYVKHRVFEAALMSSVLCGCESWFHADLRPVNKIYNWGIKKLLGVRMSTCNDLCYLELGLPPLRALVTHRQENSSKGFGIRGSTLLMTAGPTLLSQL